jgi:hypothetical protein
VFVINNQKLYFFDYSTATNYGFSGSGNAVLSSGIIFFLNSSWFLITYSSIYQASSIMSHLSKTDCLGGFT